MLARHREERSDACLPAGRKQSQLTDQKEIASPSGDLPDRLSYARNDIVRKCDLYPVLLMIRDTGSSQVSPKIIKTITVRMMKVTTTTRVRSQSLFLALAKDFSSGVRIWLVAPSIGMGRNSLSWFGSSNE